jgi:hypothetical protein
MAEHRSTTVWGRAGAGFRRQRFANSADWLRRQVKRIAGVVIHEAALDVGKTAGSVVHVR